MGLQILRQGIPAKWMRLMVKAILNFESDMDFILKAIFRIFERVAFKSEAIKATFLRLLAFKVKYLIYLPYPMSFFYHSLKRS